MNPHQRGPISLTAENGETHWPAIPTPTKGTPMDPINLNPRGIAAAQKNSSILHYRQTESSKWTQTKSGLFAGPLRRFAAAVAAIPYTLPVQRLVGLIEGLGA